ncbi:MAG: chitobiase/beta-hexosaminidase C-terminal domain-containing protein, partial [Bacteroidales bacterium]|nr:chitobiase/beta-hexosaminidase C-terminal domain-containing protein [Bacteroidales bacterium]
MLQALSPLGLYVSPLAGIKLHQRVGTSVVGATHVTGGILEIFFYLRMAMHHRLFILLLIFPLSLPLSVSIDGQNHLPDTIPYEKGFLKSTTDHLHDYTYENTVDTTITLVINEILAQNSDLFYDNAGDDDDWFEIYNYGEVPILLNDLWFSDNPGNPAKWKIDTTDHIYLEPGEYYIIWADEEPHQGHNHATFRLSGDGEFLGIFDLQTDPVDQVFTPHQAPNISYGRSAGAGLDWYYFDEPTPGEENGSNGAFGILPKPILNEEGGLLTHPKWITLSSPVAGAETRYTLDCSDPTENDSLYNGPLLINETTVLKARLFKPNHLKGPVLTRTFFFEDKLFENPVLSIVSDPDLLFGTGGLISTRSKTKEIPGH